MWSKLKTLVTQMGVPPSDTLLNAFIQSENKQTRATDVDLTLKILKKGANKQEGKAKRDPRFESKQNFKKPPVGGQAAKPPPKPPVFEQKGKPKEKSYLSGVGLKAMARCQS